MRSRAITVATTGTLVYKASGASANRPQFMTITVDGDVYIGGTQADTQSTPLRFAWGSGDGQLVLPLASPGEEVWVAAASTTQEVSYVVNGYDGQHDDLNPDT